MMLCSSEATVFSDRSAGGGGGGGVGGGGTEFSASYPEKQEENMFLYL